MGLKHSYVIINQHFEAYNQVDDFGTFGSGTILEAKLFKISELDSAKHIRDHLNNIDYSGRWRVVLLKQALIESVEYLSTKGVDVDYNSINNSLYMHRLFEDITAQMNLLWRIEIDENKFSY